MVEQHQAQERPATAQRRWADVAAWMCVVLSLSAVAIVAGEQALERQIAACLSSQAILVERMIIATIALSLVAILAGALALIGRSRGWLSASLGMVLAVAAIWIAAGGYQCSMMTA